MFGLFSKKKKTTAVTITTDEVMHRAKQNGPLKNIEELGGEAAVLQAVHDKCVYLNMALGLNVQNGAPRNLQECLQLLEYAPEMIIGMRQQLGRTIR